MKVAPRHARSKLRLAATAVAGLALLLTTLGPVPGALATDGGVDLGFGSGGHVATDVFGETDEANAVAIQDDGKIVVGGFAHSGSTDQFVLARYTTAGVLDTLFDTDGIVTTPVATWPRQVFSIVIQDDQKILAAGGVTLVRYNTDGSLDTAFDTDGIATFDFANTIDYVFAIALQQDQKIVGAGYSDLGGDQRLAAFRFGTDGSLDTSFGNGGAAVANFDGVFDYGSSVAIQDDGKVVVAGSTRADDTNRDFALARWNSDGTLDSTFGSSGKVSTEVGSDADFASAVAIQPDGKLVVAGTTGDVTNYDWALARYSPDGTLDFGFGVSGLSQTDWAGETDWASSLVLDPNGSIIVAGRTQQTSQYASSDFALGRFNSKGQPDLSFGSGGLITTDFYSSTDQANAVTIQPDGKLVVAGWTYSGSQENLMTARYLSGMPASKITTPKKGAKYLAKKLRTFTGTATGPPAGLQKVQIALSKKLKSGACNWWTGSAWTTGDCTTGQVWLDATGQQTWSYHLSKPLLPTSKTLKYYTAYSQALDNASQVETIFTAGTNANQFTLT